MWWFKITVNMQPVFAYGDNAEDTLKHVPGGCVFGPYLFPYTAFEAADRITAVDECVEVYA